MFYVGVHGDNREFWPEEVWARLNQARWQYIKLMTFNDLSTFDRVKREQPQAVVHTRIYGRGIPPAPRDYVEQEAGKIRQIMERGICRVFILGCEPNHLQSYGGWGPDAAPDFDIWAAEVITLLRARFPGIVILWPGLVVNPGYRDEFWWQTCERSIKMSDGLCGHGYFQWASHVLDYTWGLRWVVGHRMYLDKPLWVTEAGCTFNQVTKEQRIPLFKQMAEGSAKEGARGIAFWILGGTEEWEQVENSHFDDNMAREIGAYRVEGIMQVTQIYDKITNYGSRGGHRPRLIIVHTTRSGKDITPEQELQATINWFSSPASVASSHDLIAANGDRYECVHPDNMAWHAGYLNSTSIGIELVQQKADIPFTATQYEALTIRIAQLCRDYQIPMVHVTDENQAGIIGHDETDQGQAQGKSDPGALFDWSKVTGPLGPLPAPIEKPHVGAYLDTLWGLANELEAAGKAQAEAASRLRDYLVLIKQEIDS